MVCSGYQYYFLLLLFLFSEDCREMNLISLADLVKKKKYSPSHPIPINHTNCCHRSVDSCNDNIMKSVLNFNEAR